MTEWHHLLGITLKDFFFNSSYHVEVEQDLSLKKQFLDVLIIEKKEGNPPSELPDGFENLSAHNLITYKSHQESLDGWTLDELLSHYVLYRKIISPADKLLSVNDFRLFALSTRYPEKLTEQTDFRSVKKGVYEVTWGINKITVIVLSRIPPEEKNAVWNMFSAEQENVKYGLNCYRWRIEDVTPIVADALFRKYKTEGVIMPYTIEDFIRNARQDFINSLTLDDVLKKFSADDLLKNFSLKEILSKSKPEEIESYLKELKQTVH